MRGHLVVASCGHWWLESGRVKPTTPRVCAVDLSQHHTHGVVGTSPQGLDMVHVRYMAGDILDWHPCIHWPDGTTRRTGGVDPDEFDDWWTVGWINQ